jgi:tetratricopeptide (TPR) repeat protein
MNVFQRGGLTRPPASPPSASAAIDALYATGHWLFSQERYRDASSVFRAMLACAPDDERGWLALGACHEKNGQPVLALELYGVGRVLAKPSGRCEVARSRVLRERDQTEQATEALDQAQKIADETGDDELLALVARERSTP